MEVPLVIIHFNRIFLDKPSIVKIHVFLASIPIPKIYWLVVWLPFLIFPLILGISSSQLTHSYFSEGWPWPTNQICFELFSSGSTEHQIPIPKIYAVIYGFYGAVLSYVGIFAGELGLRGRHPSSEVCPGPLDLDGSG